MLRVVLPLLLVSWAAGGAPPPAAPSPAITKAPGGAGGAADAAGMKAPGGAGGAADAAGETQTIVGQIVSVDVAASSLVVGESVQASPTKKGDRETVSVKVDGATQISRGKRTATLAELHPRDHVVVRYVVTSQGARALSIRAADQARETPTAPPPGAPG